MQRYRYRPDTPSFQSARRMPTREQAIVEQLRDGQFEQLVDRSVPLPDGLSVEQTIRALSKVYLGLFDARWGLTGDIPQRRRW